MAKEIMLEDMVEQHCLVYQGYEQKHESSVINKGTTDQKLSPKPCFHDPHRYLEAGFTVSPGYSQAIKLKTSSIVTILNTLQS